MSNPFVAEIRIFPFNFAPVGWAMCNGQILPISQNTALFSLLGTTYGGDGKSNFALPNLQGSTPLNPGQGPGLSLYDLGESGGSTTVNLLTSEIPSHTHAPACNSAAGSQSSPSGAVWAASSGGRTPPPHYSDATPNQYMLAGNLGLAGGDQAHNNLQPYLTLNFCIALQGVFPARS